MNHSKFKSVLIILGVIFCSNSIAAGKLFIIGGGERTSAIMKRMVAESGLDKGGYAVILPMSSEEPDTAYYYTKLDFIAAGCSDVQNLFCTKNRVNDKSIADSILNAKLIFISGGDQSRFMNLVKGSSLLMAIRKAYQNGKVIAGTSAGAAMMSEIMITGNSLRDTNYSATFKIIEPGNIETSEGLGLVKTVIIDQHFVWRSRHNRLITAVLEFSDKAGVGIDESTAIIVNGNDAEVIGESQVLVYRNRSKKKSVVNGKYKAEGLSLDIYLTGDHFSLN